MVPHQSPHSEDANLLRPLPEMFPHDPNCRECLAFEVMGNVADDLALLRAPAIAGGPSYGPGPKIWVRFFQVDSEGSRVGPDAFCTAFDQLDFLVFISAPERYRRLIERNSDLAPEEEEHITKILLGKRGNLHEVRPHSE
jgi:hypothetical protein